jgi:hypothetical protein
MHPTLFFILLVLIAQFYSPAKIVGVDIDEYLIVKAKAHLKFIYSLMKPHVITLNDNERPQDLDSPRLSDLAYFPLSCPLVHGVIHGSYQGNASSFPFNTHFRQAEWVHEPLIADDTVYDVILGYGLSFE